MCRGGVERLVTEVPLRAPPAPHSQPLQSWHNRRLLAVGSSEKPGSVHAPERPGLLHQRPQAGTKATRGAQHRPNGPFAHLAKAGRRSTGVPKVTRTLYPPSRSAKPSRSARAEPSVGRHWRLWPTAPAESAKGGGGGVALRKSPRGSPEKRRTPAPASRAGRASCLPLGLGSDPSCPQQPVTSASGVTRPGAGTCPCFTLQGVWAMFCGDQAPQTRGVRPSRGFWLVPADPLLHARPELSSVTGTRSPARRRCPPSVCVDKRTLAELSTSSFTEEWKLSGA